MGISLVLSLPRDEASVPVIRHICRDALHAVGVTRMCSADIELALTEACTNVLKHAPGSRDGYDVSVEIDHSVCEIRVVDSGSGFDHAGPGVREEHEVAEGGRGINLMRALVDDVSFDSRPADGTIVSLAKALELTERSLLHKLAGE